MAGETGPISSRSSLPIDMTIAGFFAIAVYNCIEILITLFDRFKKYRGLYFWSILVTTLGILLHSIVVLLRFYALGPNFVLAVLTCVGWYGMVTGFSVVLYSRLHLVVRDRSKTRWVLVMIICSFFLFHVPVTILFLGSNTRQLAYFLHAFDIYERIQLAGFCIQESLISGFYIFESIRTLRPILIIKLPKERKIIRHLILVNALVIILDISLLATEYTGNFQIQTTYKPVVYSIKLKMEFVILNRLLRLVQRSGYERWFVLDSDGTTQTGPTPSSTGFFDDHADSFDIWAARPARNDPSAYRLRQISEPQATRPSAFATPARRAYSTPIPSVPPVKES